MSRWNFAQSWPEWPLRTIDTSVEGLSLEYCGGACPTQAWGTIDGQRFYFRARGGGWSFEVGPCAPDVIPKPCEWYREGDDPTGGWMTDDQALWLVGALLAEWRSR